MNLEFVFPQMFGFSDIEKKSLENITRSIISQFQGEGLYDCGKKVLIIGYGLPYLDFPNGSTTGHFYDLSIPWHLPEFYQAILEIFVRS